MHPEAIYKKETGKEAMYEMEDPRNCNRSDLHYYDAYVEWLENKLMQALEQKNGSLCEYAVNLND